MLCAWTSTCALSGLACSVLFDDGPASAGVDAAAGDTAAPGAGDAALPPGRMVFVTAFPYASTQLDTKEATDGLCDTAKLAGTEAVKARNFKAYVARPGYEPTDRPISNKGPIVASPTGWITAGGEKLARLAPEVWRDPHPAVPPEWVAFTSSGARLSDDIKIWEGNAGAEGDTGHCLGWRNSNPTESAWTLSGTLQRTTTTPCSELAHVLCVEVP